MEFSKMPCDCYISTNAKRNEYKQCVVLSLPRLNALKCWNPTLQDALKSGILSVELQSTRTDPKFVASLQATFLRNHCSSLAFHLI